MHQLTPQTTADLIPTIQAYFPPTTFALLTALADRAARLGMPLYLVGGSVRDILLGRASKDLDLVVEGDTVALALSASRKMDGDVPMRSQFGTATLKLGGLRFDLATARRESYSRPGALPTVSPGSIEEDLGRRDFSVNAMAIALWGPRTGALLDPVRGRDDLDRKLIRVLHPESFEDDATRILRAVRYEQRLGFQIEARTLELLLDGVQRGMLDTIGGSRVRMELKLMFEEDAPGFSLSRSGELGILQAIYPPLGQGDRAVRLGAHSDGAAPLDYLAALSYPLTEAEGESFISRLRMPSGWARVVRDTVSLKTQTDGPSSTVSTRVPPGELCALLDRYSVTSVKTNALLTKSPDVREALRLYLDRLRYVKPALKGGDLISMGVAEGPMVGELLRQIKSARFEGRITTRKQEVELAREYVASRGG